jgi:hypothetical protein
MPRLISDSYQKLNHNLHKEQQAYGGDGRVAIWIPYIVSTAKSSNFRTLLDYGCGKGDLKPLLAIEAPFLDVREYDPAVAGKTRLPAPADMVCCLDVMEHIEPQYLEAVITHISDVTIHCCIMRVALTPANKTLADGRNAHLILESPEWWTDKIQRSFNILRSSTNCNKEQVPTTVDYVLSRKSGPQTARPIDGVPEKE